MLRRIILTTLLAVTLQEAKANNLVQYEHQVEAYIEHYKSRLTTTMMNRRDIQCLAMNIYFEARGERTLGQVAVANTTINRAGNSNNICRVVYQPNQFSWTSMPRRRPVGEPWQKALTLAWLAINEPELIRDITRGSNYFHSYRRTPQLFRQFSHTITIGNHRFYRQDTPVVEVAEAR